MNRGQRRQGRRVGCFLLMLAFLAGPPPGLAANALSLLPQREQWSELVFLDDLQGRITASQAVRFGYGSDPRLGGTVSVGPWHAGSWGARLEYKRPFASPTGTIRGYYRTEGLLPYQTGVIVAFMKGTTTLAKRRHHLAPSPSWRQFTVSVRFPPAGADSFKAAFGLSDQTAGRVEFARLTIDSGAEGLTFPGEPAAVTRPSPTTTFAAGGAFRLEKEGETHWLVTPAGTPFYSIATDGPSGKAKDGPVRPGAEWAAFLRDLGFNSLAGWTSVGYWSEVNDDLESAGAEPLPLFATVESNTLPGHFGRLEDAQGNSGMPGHAFPDPFDPAFEAAYRAKVLKTHQSLAGKRWFAGWFADNELDHTGLERQVYSPHCAVALRDFLVRRHGTIGALNQAWQTAYPSFDALLAARPDPLTPAGAMAEDFRMFAREIVSRYIDTTIRVIRSVDPGRLVFSNRFMSSGMSGNAAVMDLYARYDGVAVNLYPQNQQPGLSDNETAFLRFFNERTGKAVLVTEWSVPALDSGLYDGPPKSLDWSWNTVTGTQAERGKQAARLTVDFYNLPFVVGAQWFTWKDFRGERLANRGLLDAGGQPWEELLRQLRDSQKRIGP